MVLARHVGSGALGGWKSGVFRIICGGVSFYCNDLGLLPPRPGFTFGHLGGSRSSLRGLFWPQRLGLLAVLWSFERGTILTPYGGNLALLVVWAWQAWWVVCRWWASVKCCSWDWVLWWGPWWASCVLVLVTCTWWAAL